MRSHWNLDANKSIETINETDEIKNAAEQVLQDKAHDGRPKKAYFAYVCEDLRRPTQYCEI